MATPGWKKPQMPLAKRITVRENQAALRLQDRSPTAIARAVRLSA